MFDWQQEAEQRYSRFGGERFRAAVDAISEAYRAGKSTSAPRLDDELLVSAYLAVRFPATFAANLAVCRAVVEAAGARLATPFQPTSLLDLGAGCAAGALAWKTHFDSIETISAVEQMPAMISMGRQVLPDAIWRNVRLETTTEFAAHDIVLLSYSYGESRADTHLLEKAWAAATQLLVLIEPGTPRGFAALLEARQRLIGVGANVLAPCPANEACPSRVAPEWCHFSTRLNRSALHRRLKGGTLSYEDEKFSYLVVTRAPVSAGLPRVTRHPLIEPGRITMELCTAPTRQQKYVTKKNKELFRVARKTEWGDTFDIAAI